LERKSFCGVGRTRCKRARAWQKDWSGKPDPTKEGNALKNHIEESNSKVIGIYMRQKISGAKTGEMRILGKF
jgi:hypothetical protein